MIELRPLTKEDIEIFHEHAETNNIPHINPYARTIRGWAIEEHGRLVCIAGVTIGDDYVEAFSDIMPGIQSSKRTIWKYAKMLADNIKALGLDPIAVAKADWPNSGKFLESVGFKSLGNMKSKNIYRI